MPVLILRFYWWVGHTSSKTNILRRDAAFPRPIFDIGTCVKAVGVVSAGAGISIAFQQSGCASSIYDCRCYQENRSSRIEIVPLAIRLVGGPATTLF